MRIEKLEVENFRFFKKESFNFPTLFTVLIGENGRGKSALLHGLRVAAGAWLLGFRETERLHIEPEDVRRVDSVTRFAPQFPVLVRATGLVEGQAIQWTRQRNDFKGGMGRTGWAEAKPLLELARQCEEATNVQLREIALPVLVYFSTARLWVGAKKAVELKTKGSKIQDGYAQALTAEHKRTGAAGRIKALGWIKKASLKVSEEKLRSFQAMDYHGPANALEKRWLVNEYGKSDTQPLLNAVLEAITTCVEEWKYLNWDLETDDLSGVYYRPDGSTERVPLYYLSDGLRTMAGMVAEIAYRCVTLNGHLGKEAVTGSKGLVLIDELDMHLHPNWQRRVVSDLKKAFPNLQFVVTTHSPFIVQSLDSSELINLDYDNSDVQPKDLRLEDVATKLMDVESPLSIEGEHNQQVADEHLELLRAAEQITAGQLDQTTSQQLRLLEESVSDPALRAVLRMERVIREHPAS